jgi:hypothetical protein
VANAVRIHYPPARERVQMNFRVPVELKHAVIASALDQGQGIEREAIQLIQLGLEARRQAVAA